MENKENRKMRQNKFQNVPSLADTEQENRVTISYIKEICPKERELNALKEEFEQIEIAEEKMRHQITEKQKNILQMDEDNTFRSNAYKNNKDHEKQLRKSVHSLKNEIGLLNRDPLTERDREKLLISKKKLVWYEKCTGVFFDFSSKDPIKGLVQNPRTNYVSTFQVDKNSNVEKTLWLESTKGGVLQCPQHST
ncbi:hypothetical protein R5R35_014148 [Gryllus longicercus]|uniref:Uncharacterized protein n=1 Tax=Gryllus longicercus TaxID=2509291 RepID=A0AAN9Z2M2_9ORTH